MLLISPQNGRTAFRSNNGVDGVLQHVNAIAGTDGECSSRTAFPGDCGDNRHLNARHFAQVVCNRLCLPTFFCIDARICSRSVDESQHRAVELLCQFHDTQRLAVALRFRHTEVSILALFRISSLLMTDYADRYIPQYAEATDNGGIIAEFPVTMDFDEFRTEVLHIIQKVRTLRMPCKLYLLVR